MYTPSPFHEGEQRVQTMLGVREDIEPWASQVVRPYLPEEHRAFHTALPFLVVSARDAGGRPWATLLAGPEGFVGPQRAEATTPSEPDAKAQPANGWDDAPEPEPAPETAAPEPAVEPVLEPEKTAPARVEQLSWLLAAAETPSRTEEIVAPRGTKMAVT